MLLTNKTQFSKCMSLDSDGQFIAHYQHLVLRSVFQPIFSRDNRIVGVEALVRITANGSTTIRPDCFFHSDTINPIDKLNVERLSRVIHIRNYALSEYRQCQLFLNLLPVAGELFAISDINKALLCDRLKELHIEHNQLVMELIEIDSENESKLQCATQSLVANGFKIAIDDFGTQASTPQRVNLVTPDIIKFDRSLLLKYMQGDCDPLMDGITLAKQNGSNTVVEGIETQAQLEAMQKLDIDMFQGYFLAMPEAIVPAIKMAI
ncbi:MULTISPECIES: EAL domain-containing protein [unclassified Vibrio]|uniref:EAL domain-containing protein n=1 Tax=unclassified Vibrio TaxID=2614977 RepID=UPI000B8E6549|nr:MULTISPECIES: EAL domain-containing protein [unclassified Vibrio]NAX45282.1 EAL domain-containing protein [Vibrio sp. V25_P4S6T154]OXX42736.1 diguanylate phosphodiesterase [Vibrio sp. V17_P4S1T151]OXX61842.1 diguanylate phosphodiesterase [Vibrio sp. V15_P4S5T153]OXX71794.1 diguanylate phosphodiesterase [Vibrio sp. V20_P4S3T152]